MDFEAITSTLWINEQIKAVTFRYARALDDCVWPLLRSCFTEDAVGDFGPWGLAQGVEEIMEAVAVVMDGMDQTQHLVSNHAIEVAPNFESARSECNLVAEHLLVTPEGSSTSTTRGVYTDDWKTVGGEWRLAARVIKMTWREGNTGIFGVAAERSSRSRSGT